MQKLWMLIACLVAILDLPSCSHQTTKALPRCLFGKDVEKISSMIKVVQPELGKYSRERVACFISEVSNSNKLDSKILVAIIDTESDFKETKISSTGDISIAQINVEIWNKEFTRIKHKPIDTKRLAVDSRYAVKVMGDILTILKSRYSESDKVWYARYHSGNEKYKKEYLAKLTKRLQMIDEDFEEEQG
jgi:hypothetical protein